MTKKIDKILGNSEGVHASALPEVSFFLDKNN